MQAEKTQAPIEEVKLYLARILFSVNYLEGTLYPMYTRLQKSGVIEATTKESPLGPARKYYSLTPKGRDALHQFYEAWMYMSENVNNIVKGKLL